jgi:NAD(P)H-hydrate epimerase
MLHNYQSYFNKIKLPRPNSHKGQNGKVLVIGGSQLFHSSIFWSAQVASKFVDMVHFSSPANENNQLVRTKLKQGFWQGIVVDWDKINTYITEDNVILIGPGMERKNETKKIVNSLLKKYPKKKWVIDGGALQEVDPSLLGKGHIITPHKKEMKRLIDCHSENSSEAWDVQNLKTEQPKILKQVQDDMNGFISQLTSRGVTILAKNVIDRVYYHDKVIKIEGGNAGLTKGGSGDILAGLVAALYTQTEAVVACVVASVTIKKSAEALWQQVGPNFNADDLIKQIPKTFWELHRTKS